GDEQRARVRDPVRGLNGRRARVVVGEVPRRDPAVGVEAGLDFKQSGGTEVGPHEFLGPRPAQAHGTSGLTREPRRVNGALAGVLAAEAAAGVRHDHTDFFGRDVERLGQLTLYIVRTLRARPHRQLAVFPLGDGRAWFHRRVLDVGNLVDGPHTAIRL